MQISPVTCEFGLVVKIVWFRTRIEVEVQNGVENIEGKLDGHIGLAPSQSRPSSTQLPHFRGSTSPPITVKLLEGQKQQMSPSWSIYFWKK